MIGFLVVAGFGMAIGIYAERTFDVSFQIQAAWEKLMDRFNP